MEHEFYDKSSYPSMIVSLWYAYSKVSSTDRVTDKAPHSDLCIPHLA